MSWVDSVRAPVHRCVTYYDVTQSYFAKFTNMNIKVTHLEFFDLESQNWLKKLQFMKGQMVTSTGVQM